MKGRGDQQPHQVIDQDSKHINNNMFSNLHHHFQHQHPSHHHHQHQFHHPHQHHQQQQQQQQLQCQTASSEDNETRSSGAKKIKTDLEETTTHNSGGTTDNRDGGSIEVVRRPRGRPPGSKNKPKPPIIITREITSPNPECAMRPHVLEISSGHDIIDSISRFTRKRNLGICILTASGSVTNVSLRQPSTSPPGHGHATVTFHGRFDILSISATFLPHPTSSSPSISGFSNGAGFTISLAGPQGQIFGGLVIGSLMAASTVYIVASSFNNPSYHRLPLSSMDEEAEEEEDHHHHHQQGHIQPLSASAGGSEESNPAQTEALSMNYSCHLPSDVIWAPTPRQPPPPPHPF